MTARLPQPGSDDGTWGTILNDFLSVVHNGDGTLQNGIITNANVASTAAIARTKLDASTQASLDKADTALQSAPVTSVNSKTGAVSLTAGDVGADSAGAATAAQAASLQIANNLADLNAVSTARTNLGLGNAATLNVGTTTGTVAAGDDSRLTAASTAVQSVNGKAGTSITLTTGPVVGTTDTQTLTNKTIDGSVNTLSNIPESAVTNLATDLSGKMDSAATAWAKGSLLVGTGSGSYDTFPVGADGSYLVISGGTLVYSAAPSPILGSTTYDTAVTFPNPEAALSTINLTITFTAPTSGKVLLRAVMQLTNNGGYYSFSAFTGWFTHGTSTRVGQTRTLINFSDSGGPAYWSAGEVLSEQLITGLTAGQSYTYDLTGQSSSGGGQGSQFVLTAWAA